MLRTRPLSTHDYTPFPQDHLHLQPFQPQFLENFNPQRSMFETNPETCFVHILCPPAATPLSPRIISICNPFNLNFQNISAHNEACLRLALKHASYTSSVRPQLPPFPLGSSPSATPSTSISKIFQPTTKHVWDSPWNMLRTRPVSTHNYPPFPQDHLHLQPLQPQFPEYFSPQRSMFETNPETCFVHGLCPPTSTPLSPTIISICSCFNLNFLNISPRNKACLRLTLKHASCMAAVHSYLPPFPPGSSPSATPSTSISSIFQPTTKHVWD